MLAHGLSHFDLANPIRRCLKPIKTAFATIQCRVEWCGWLGSNMGRWCYWSFWLWSRTLLLGTVLWCFFSKLLWECVTFLVQSEIGIFCGFFIMCVNGKLSCANGFGFSLWNINFCFGNWLVPHGFSWDNVVFLAVPKTRLCLKPKLIIERKKKRLYFIASETKLVNKNCYLPLGFSRANFGCLVGLLVDFWLRIVGFAWYHIIV